MCILSSACGSYCSFDLLVLLAAEDGSDDAADEGKASKTKKSKRDTANDETEKDGEGENGGDNDVATSEVEDAGTDVLA